MNIEHPKWPGIIARLEDQYRKLNAELARLDEAQAAAWCACANLPLGSPAEREAYTKYDRLSDGAIRVAGQLDVLEEIIGQRTAIELGSVTCQD